ncbi:conserved hypothetical protein [Clostridium botulinum C str. Eklund]|nr:conserved hypothetical protein [Clostridium botulinum C str. Eklund]
MTKKFDINDIMDTKEASEKFDININTLKTICQRGMHGLIEGEDYRKTGRVWLITIDGMKKILNSKKVD